MKTTLQMYSKCVDADHDPFCTKTCKNRNVLGPHTSREHRAAAGGCRAAAAAGNPVGHYRSGGRPGGVEARMPHNDSEVRCRDLVSKTT